MGNNYFAKHVYGDSRRIFLNTELGCASACSYCYLPSEGFSIDASKDETIRTSAKTILAGIRDDSRVIAGPNGTIFSIGCFSECWDRRNRDETLALILGLLPLGNPIQLASKRKIRKEDLLPIVRSPHWKEQLHVYISSASVSEWATHERGTTSPHQRFKSFNACQQLGIRSFLYIKPVLPNITIHDVPIYAEIMKHNRVDAVIGDLFERNSNELMSPISTNLFVSVHSDVNHIKNALRIHGSVYTNSTETLAHMEPQ